jgi:hypothetical protein
MNANELADELHKIYIQEAAECWDVVDEAATMLRQQQAEIEALKAKKLNDLYADGEIAGWIGYYEGKVCTFIFKEEDMEEFLKNTEPVGKVCPVYTTPRIKL